MTEAAGERFAGMTAAEARTAVVAALEAEGRDLAARALHARRAVLAPLGRADRAADLAAVVHAHGRAGRAGDRGRARRARCASTPSAGAASTSTGSRTSGRGASRASSGGATGCRSGTAGEETYVGREPPEGEGWERDPDVLDTWFSSALWPFATLGWPERDAELRAFYPTDVLVTARDIIFLWVARMVMMGLEFAGEIPFTDVYITRSSRRPTAGACRSRSAPASTRSTRSTTHGADARALRPAGDVLLAGRALLGREDRSRASSSPTSCGTRRGWCCCAPTWTRRRAAPETVEDRWILSRLERTKREVDRADRALRLLARRARALRVRLRRALRLVPGDGQAAPLRRGRGRAQRVSATLLYVLERDARARAPAHAVRDRGDLVVPAARRGAARGRAVPAAEPGLIDDEAERELERRDRGRPALRGWRDAVGAAARRSGCRRASWPTGYEATAEPGRAARALRARPGRRLDGDAGRVDRGAGRRGRGARLRRGRSRRGRGAPRAASAPSSRPRSSAREGKLANEGFVAKAPPERGGGRAREARAPARGELATL